MADDKDMESLKERLDEAEMIVVGGASGMSAASGFRFYYVDDPVFRSIAGGLAAKYGYANYFDGYYCRERNYYIVTTNQDAQFYRTFSAEKITRLQGDVRYFQCGKPCHDAIYYNHEMVMELVPQIRNDCLPESLWPRCPVCDGQLEPWVRGPKFLEGDFYQREFARYMDALKSGLDKKTLFLELGVGMMTPMFIKEPFMNMVFQWPHGFYATINPQHALVPEEIAAKSIAIDCDLLLALKRLLGKDTSGIVASGDAFNPRKVY